MELQTKRSTLEITKEEWDTRKLSQYGYFSGIIDIVYIVLNLVAMGAIISYIIPSYTAQPGVLLFWQILITILFIQGLKGVSLLLDPRNSYQTIIIRK